MFARSLVEEVIAALHRRPPLIQVIVGPRQVGKTTAAEQIAEKIGWPAHIATADAARPHSPEWIETQWQLAARRASGQRVLLVLDEIQKVPGWNEVLKRLWDEQRRTRTHVRPLLLGSSALLVHKGATESLSGRFFLHRCMHWSWPETRAAFGWDLERWLYFGGYPGAAPLADHLETWKRYVNDSLVETVIARDVLQLQSVNKPALLRHLFGVAVGYPAQIVSFNKMLGQLHDAGNTTTLAHYLGLLETAFLISGLPVFSASVVRKRASSPKLVLWNNALVNAPSPGGFEDARRDPQRWGRLVENAVGAHLLNSLHGPAWSIAHWRDGPAEVDFIVGHGADIWALEVKSGRSGRASGLSAFRQRYPKARTWLLGADGLSLADFFAKPAGEWFT